MLSIEKIRSIKKIFSEFNFEFQMEDRSEVVLFAHNSKREGFGSETGQISEGELNKYQRKISMITTVLNEEGNILQWLDSLAKQTRVPDELIIVDGGSADDTIPMIKKYVPNLPFPSFILESRGANIARGRNKAIEYASFDIIVCTDIGCKLDPNWFAYLTYPFEIDNFVQVSFGIYLAIDLSAPYAKLLIPKYSKIKPQEFYPSSRSLAFNKNLWKIVGGYPEWLSDAGEDTYFDILLKNQPARWAYVPEAIVYWDGPKSLIEIVKTAYRYSVGDGEAGLYTGKYKKKIIKTGILMCGLLFMSVILVILSLQKAYTALLVALITIGILVFLSLGLAYHNYRNLFIREIMNFFYLRVYSMSQIIGFIDGVVKRYKSKRLPV